MRVEDYHYELPRELIARYPLAERTKSRLLVLEPQRGVLGDFHFADLLGFLSPGDLLVFNNTKVIPARIFGQKATGGKIELLVERILPDNRLSGHIRASKAPQLGSELLLGHGPAVPGEDFACKINLLSADPCAMGVSKGGESRFSPFCASGNLIPTQHKYQEEIPIKAPPGISGDGQRATVLSRQGALYELQMDLDLDILAWLESVGEIPLPPYLERAAEEGDKERYQTVFARHPGAVAAPTAGLHFDEALLTDLAKQGIETAYLTLHVGAGTFAPLRAEQLETGKLHAERIEVTEALCEQILATKKRGGKVIAVGTTTVRALETAAAFASKKKTNLSNYKSPGVDAQESSLNNSDELLIDSKEKQADSQNRVSPENTLPEIQPYSGETDIFITPGFEFRIVDAMITNFHLPESSLMMLVSAFAGYDTTMAAYRYAVQARYRFFSYGDAMLIGDFSEKHNDEI